MNKLKICICGGGSLGLICASVFVNQGHCVNIFTGHPQAWSKFIKSTDLDGKVYCGDLNIISDNPEKAISGADIVLLTVPGYLIDKTLNDIKSHIQPQTKVGSIVSSTGFFFMAHQTLDEAITLFGFQRVPFIARYEEYGCKGKLLGYKQNLNVAIENSENVEELRDLLERLFLTPVSVLDNFYEASLSNSNPILHTSRLYSMWRDFDGRPYQYQSHFYADWTQEDSHILITMDNEFQKLLQTLNIREGVIPSLLNYYEASDTESLTAKIRSIPAFKEILSPMIEVDGGWIPNFSSRYFTEDFSFGLKYIKDIANSSGVKTPMIDTVYNWGMSEITKFNKG